MERLNNFSKSNSQELGLGQGQRSLKFTSHFPSLTSHCLQIKFKEFWQKSRIFREKNITIKQSCLFQNIAKIWILSTVTQGTKNHTQMCFIKLISIFFNQINCKIVLKNVYVPDVSPNSDNIATTKLHKIFHNIVLLSELLKYKLGK